jgi:hypothetical protein
MTTAETSTSGGSLTLTSRQAHGAPAVAGSAFPLLLLRCAGLNSEQLVVRSAPPSSLSLLGLVRHASEVERTWLRRRMARQDIPLLNATPDAPDAAFDGTQA